MTKKLIEEIAKVLKEEISSSEFRFIKNNQIFFLDEDMMTAQRCQESWECKNNEPDEDCDPAVALKYVKIYVSSTMEERFPKVKYEIDNYCDKGWVITIK